MNAESDTAACNGAERPYYLAFVSVTFFLCFLILLVSLPSHDFFHRDEANFVRVSKFSFTTFFLKQDFEHEGWSQSFRTFGRDNPHIAKYIMGSSLWIHGFRTFDGTVRWDGDKSFEWHIEQAIVPTTSELYAARLPIALLSAMTAATLAFITYISLSFFVRSHAARCLGGMTGAALYLGNPVIWAYSHRAMPDVPALFFSCITICLALKTLQLHLNRQFYRSYAVSSLGAIAVGLAISSKLNAALTGITIALVFLIICLHEIRIQTEGNLILFKRWLPHAVLWGAVPIGIFILSNPYLYENTMENMEVIRSLADRVTERRERLPDFALYGVQDRLAAFLGHATGSTARLLKFDFPLFEVILSGTGLLILVRALYQRRRRPPTQESILCTVLLSWTVVSVVGVLWWTPLSWDRYYAPSIPALSVLGALAVAYVADLSIRAVRRSQQ